MMTWLIMNADIASMSSPAHQSEVAVGNEPRVALELLPSAGRVRLPCSCRGLISSGGAKLVHKLHGNWNVLGEDGNDDPSAQRHVGFFEASSHLISRRAGSGEPSAGLKVGRKYTPTVKSLKRPSVVKVTQCLLFS